MPHIYVVEYSPGSMLQTGSRMWFVALTIALVLSATLGELLRRIALRRMLVDVPNERSLHQKPVPRVGGIGLVLGAACALSIARIHGNVSTVAIAGGCVALLGAVDDLRPLSAGLRFAVQGGLAIFVVASCGPAVLPLVHGTYLPYALTVILIVGSLNIYNFMDGMDGLAASQAITAGTAQAIIFAASGLGDAALVSGCLAAAALGFLLHNFPPARMFMGDAGATTLGFVFAGLASVGSQHGIPLTTSLLPLGPFLLDGVFTIFRRALKGERVWRAHRSHLYQRAVQSGLTHRIVLGVYWIWFVACTLPAVFRLPAVVGWSIAVLGLAVAFLWVRKLEAHSQVARRA
jgi:UDP-N-acetylmuramyl pentapeptide phosphotransferase/UDP-N-acetylglucosamine-1-phosphate transferase